MSLWVRTFLELREVIYCLDKISFRLRTNPWDNESKSSEISGIWINIDPYP